MQDAVCLYTAPFGAVRIVAGETALLRVDFAHAVRQKGSAAAEDILSRAVSMLDAYAAGTFDAALPLDPPGSAFQRAVWQALRRIPFGETRTYGEVAEMIGKPAASRAVGLACGANPLSILIPCHRVVGSSGKLTGYAGGLPFKQALLTFEARACGRVLALAS